MRGVSIGYMCVVNMLSICSYLLIQLCSHPNIGHLVWERVDDVVYGK